MVNYKLPTITEYSVQEHIRGTNWGSVPQEAMEAFNKEVATEVAENIKMFVVDRGEASVDDDLVRDIFRETVREVAYRYLEDEGTEIDDVIHSEEDLITEEEYDDFRFVEEKQ